MTDNRTDYRDTTNVDAAYHEAQRGLDMARRKLADAESHLIKAELEFKRASRGYFQHHFSE